MECSSEREMMYTMKHNNFQTPKSQFDNFTYLNMYV